MLSSDKIIDLRQVRSKKVSNTCLEDLNDKERQKIAEEKLIDEMIQKLNQLLDSLCDKGPQIKRSSQNNATR